MYLCFQSCDDMFIYSKWNSSTTYTHGENKRDFGTDYGICCWYTPQLNFRWGALLYIIRRFVVITFVFVLTETGLTLIILFKHTNTVPHNKIDRQGGVISQANTFQRHPLRPRHWLELLVWNCQERRQDWERQWILRIVWYRVLWLRLLWRGERGAEGERWLDCSKGRVDFHL